MVAAHSMQRGTVIHVLKGIRVPHVRRTTIRVARGNILDPIGKYFNHACSPSVVIDEKDGTVRAMRTISRGEKLTYNYLAHEHQWNVPFQCYNCGVWLSSLSSPCMGRGSAIQKR
jgi:hypothetical protein